MVRIGRLITIASGAILLFMLGGIAISAGTWWPCARLALPDACLDTHTPRCNQFIAADGVHYDFSSLPYCWALIVPFAIFIVGLLFEILIRIRTKKYLKNH